MLGSDNEAVSPSVCCCCQVAAPRKCFLPRPLPATWPAAKKRNLQSSSAETRGLLGQCLAPPRPDHSQLAEAATVRGQGTLPAEWWLKRMSLSAWSLLLWWDEVIWIMIWIWIVLHLGVARVLGVEAPVAGRRRAPPPPLTSPRHQAASPQSGGTGHQDHCSGTDNPHRICHHSLYIQLVCVMGLWLCPVWSLHSAWPPESCRTQAPLKVDIYLFIYIY